MASLPYADIDIASVVRAGLTADLATATTLGADVTAAVLGRSATGTVSPLDWPAEGTADRTALAAIQQSGTDEVLLSDVYARPVRATSYTPSGIGPLAGHRAHRGDRGRAAVPDAVDAGSAGGWGRPRRAAAAGRDGDDRPRAAVGLPVAGRGATARLDP